MTAILSTLKAPFVKQTIKNCVGAITFAIGARALYDYRRGIIYSQYATPERAIDGPKRIRDGIALNLAQASFILSTTVTPMGVWMISAVVSRVFSSAQLERLFGPNTTFELNWKHPRHIVSLVSVALALPLVVNRLFRPYAFDKQRHFEQCAIYVVITSRPVLHIGNQLAQKIWARAFK